MVRRLPSETVTALPKIPPGDVGYAVLSVDILHVLLKRKEREFTLINVHIPYTVEIPGTDLRIPYDQIEAYRGQLPEDRNTPIVAYCRSGPMSKVAVDTLAQLGYTQVYDLPGGMNLWEAQGYSLIDCLP